MFGNRGRERSNMSRCNYYGKVTLCGIALLVVSSSCQPDGDKCGKDEEVAAKLFWERYSPYNKEGARK